MNDETVQTEELSGAEAETSLPVETAADEAADGAVTEGTIYEDLAGAATEETTAEVVITLDDLHAVGNHLGHIDLFGSFLVCGTLIGLFLLRGIHGI